SLARFCPSCGETLPSADIATLIAGDATALSLEDRGSAGKPATAATGTRASTSSHTSSSPCFTRAGSCPDHCWRVAIALSLCSGREAWVRSIVLTTSHSDNRWH